MSLTSQPFWRRWSVIGPIAGLLVATAFQGLPYFRQTAPTRAPHLAQAVPAALPGWTSKDVPLGPNEFISGEVEKILNYDEVVYREYSSEGVTFSVYAAYWGAGKMPTQLVASHTPDRCWTENGWNCLDMKFRWQDPGTGIALQPAEWRIFEPPRGGPITYVLYWHLVEGRVYDYGERFNAVPHPWLWAKDAARQVLLGNREQYFIRLTSPEPLEELWTDPGFAEVLRSLADLGLGPPAPAVPRSS